MDNGIIVVKQLPVIEEQLRMVMQQVQDKVDEALSLVCTIENLKEVKSQRAELNAMFNSLETKRKEVKAQIEKPYKDFEDLYKRCIAAVFKDADKELGARIQTVEQTLKDEREYDIQQYFEEYRVSVGVPEEFAYFHLAGIKVTMSTSMKSLKASCKAFIDSVKDDLDVIKAQAYADEVLVEYKSCRNVARAINSVAERHALIEKYEAMRAASDEKETQTEIHEKEVTEVVKQYEKPIVEEPLEAPVKTQVEVKDEKKFCVSFKVTGTLQQLKDMKQFLNDGGYEYEQLN